jgi:hemolysin D
VFPVRIALSRETIRADGEDVALTPGMSVVAEVRTGNRRVIEYFLSPLMKLKDEALRER